MVVSKLDQYPMKLACHCSQITNVTIGYFDSVPTFTCPVCGTVTDTRDEPYRSFLVEWRELAIELDKHATERGEVVERLE